jgi:single-strand DNA-binding protein
MSYADINIDVKSGRLTRDAELKYTSAGFAVANFSLAYNTSKKNGDEWTTKANYIECCMFGKRAESLAPYLVKGKQVFVTGELDHQTWTSEDGKKHSKHVLKVNDIVLTAKSGGQESTPQQSNNNSGSQNSGFDPEFNDDDIPF